MRRQIDFWRWRFCCPRITIILLLVLAGFVSLPARLYGQNPAPAAAQSIPLDEAPVVLVINGLRYGDIVARIDLATMDDPYLPVEVLRKALYDSLTVAQRVKIFDSDLAALEWVNKEALEKAGFSVTWDLSTLVYAIKSPIEYSQRQDLDFSLREPVGSGPAIAPAFVSGVLNIHANAAVNISAASTTWPLTLGLNAFLKVWEIGLEADASMGYVDPSFAFTFGRARAIYDIPSIEGRLFAGIVSGEGIGQQSRPELYGVALHNETVFSRYDRRYSPSFAFTLEETSMVRMRINNEVVRSIKLDRGNYRLFDLPFVFGLNDFVLEIENIATGEVRPLKPSSMYVTTETGLLTDGSFDYGASLGFGRQAPEQPIASGFFRYGALPSLTFSTGLQVDLRSTMISGGLLWGSDVGSFALSADIVGAWDEREEPFAYAGEFRYRFFMPGRQYIPDLNLSLRYRSRGFLPPTPSSTNPLMPESRIDATIGLQSVLTRGVSAGISGMWNRTLSGEYLESGGIFANISFSIVRDVNCSITGGINFSNNADPVLRATLMVSAVNLGNSSRSISVSQSTDGDNTLMYLDRIEALDGLRYSIMGKNLFTLARGASLVALNTSYENEYVSVSGSAGLNYGNQMASPSGYINLGLGTALAFADNAFAISKPIYDSFVIFQPDRSVGNRILSFGLNSSRQTARSGMSVLAPIASYMPLRAFIDFPEMDADIQPTLPNAILSPRYRSGFAYTVGIIKHYYVVGRLLDRAGLAVGLVAGDVVGPDGKILTETFTDEHGVFQIYGLGAGTYQIQWPSKIGVSTFTLSEGIEGLVELGDISSVASDQHAGDAAEGKVDAP